MGRQGSGYFGTTDTLISTANQEIIQQNKPSNYPPITMVTYKFSFMNLQDCHVIINNSASQIFLKANMGFEIDLFDALIYSFVIVETGINYYYVGGY